MRTLFKFLLALSCVYCFGLAMMLAGEINGPLKSQDSPDSFSDGTLIYEVISYDDLTCRVKGTETDISGRLSIPDTVEYGEYRMAVAEIGKRAFALQTSLRAIFIPKTVKLIDNEAFAGSGLISANIVATEMTIEKNVFRDCTQLVHAVLSGKVTKIGENAFTNCNNLRVLECWVPTPPSVSYNSFSSWQKANTQLITNNSNYDYYSVWKEFKNKLYTNSRYDENLYYIILPNGNLRVSRPTNQKNITGTFTVPRCLTTSYLSGNITGIGAAAFASCDSVKEIRAESIKDIGPSAFAYCTSLESFISWEATSVGDHAFSNCTALNTVILPSRVSEIGDHAFYNCVELNEIDLPKYLKEIKRLTFANCSSLTSMKFPNSVEMIGDSAMYNCESLKKVILGRATKHVQKDAFGGCKIDTLECKAPTPPDIVDSSFNEWEYMNTILLVPEESLGTYENHPVWKRFVHREPSNVIKFSDGQLIYEITSESACRIIGVEGHLPDNLSIPYYTIYEESAYGITEIADYAFKNCNLISVNAPGINEMGEGAFYECKSLTNISLDNIGRISSKAFYNCSSLSNIIYNNIYTLEVIEDEAFKGCTSLRSFAFYGNRIGHNAFLNCPLELFECHSITPPTIYDDTFSYNHFYSTFLMLMNSSMEEYDKHPIWNKFENCGAGWEFRDHIFEYGITDPSEKKCVIIGIKENSDYVQYASEISIPGSARYGLDNYAVTDIHPNILNNLYNLRYLSFPNTFTRISEGVAAGCYGLVEVYIPQSVTEIGDYAFEGCQNLQYVTLPSNLSKIGNNAFILCGFTEIGIPPSVTEIGRVAFYGCHNLTNVYLTGNLNKIGSGAFQECPLETLVCWATVPPDISEDTFSEWQFENTQLSVPETVLAAYISHPVWGRFFSKPQLDAADWAIIEMIVPALTARGWSNPWDLSAGIASAESFPGLKIRQSRVVGLDLSNSSLSGEFPVELLAFPMLNALNLSGNNFDGPIEYAAAYIQQNPGAGAALAELNISHNAFSGNLGMMAACFSNLTSLDASDNCISDIYPIISENVINLDVTDQAIDRTIEYDLSSSSMEDLAQQIPTILLYDHTSQNYSRPLRLYCQMDDGFGMILSFAHGHIGISEVSSQNAYHGQSGDMLNVTALPPYGYEVLGTLSLKLLFDNGDANFDGKVNILDLQTAILFMLEKYSYLPFNFTAANLWTDEYVNVQDIICYVNLLMNSGNESYEQKPATWHHGYSQPAADEARIYVQDGMLMLDSSLPVGAFDITVGASEGIEILNTMDVRGMTVSVRKLSGGYRIIGYSLSGNCLLPGVTAIAGVDGTAFVGKAILSDNEANMIRVSSDGSTTGIGVNTIPDSDNSSLYDLQGRKVTDESRKGIFIRKDKKVIR